MSHKYLFYCNLIKLNSLKPLNIKEEMHNILMQSTSPCKALLCVSSM